jgi:transcriptional regulator with XRE-family HTH domain
VELATPRSFAQQVVGRDSRSYSSVKRQALSTPEYTIQLLAVDLDEILSVSWRRAKALFAYAMIGQRLKLARAAAGLSLRDLESKLDNRVTAQALSKYEHDEMMPSSPMLMGLAGTLDVSEECLLGEQDLALDGVEFRKKADMSAKEEAQVEAQRDWSERKRFNLAHELGHLVLEVNASVDC